MKLRATLLFTALVGGLVVLGGQPAGADAACSIVEQLTQTTGAGANASQQVAVDGNGDRIAFLSTRNLTGNNADANLELFLADTTADTITQATNTIGGAAGNSDPSISDNGTKVVFVSAADLAGDNADLGDEVFLFNSVGPTITQLSDDPTGDFANDQPDISGDGTVVVFRSDADLTGGNPDHGDELYRVNTSGTPVVVQLTSVAAGDGGSNPSVNDTGTRFAFQSTGNVVPATGNADGNTEIFVFDANGPTIAQLTVTTAPGQQDRAELSENGSFVFFESSGNLTGGNADGNRELFRRSIASTTVVQLTDTTDGAASSAVSDQSGTRVTFNNDSDDLPRNADGSAEVFVADTGVGDANAVTANPAGITSNFGSVSDDGLVVALTSQGNPLGTNADGNGEVFVARCGAITPVFNDVPPSNAFYGQIQWMDALSIANGFPGPTYRPNDPVKRQQMANFMYNLAGQPAFTPPVTPTFVDVPTSNPFYLQVEWMAAEEIASGFPGGRYKPNDPVKRQQMANFMYNLAGQPLFSAPGTPSFNDVPASNPFYLQIEWMFDEGVANGFPGGLFKPLDAVKRQQMANFMHNFAVSPGVDLG